MELASQERPYHEDNLAFAWARLMFKLVEVPETTHKVERVQALWQHIRLCSRPGPLQELLLARQLTRTWSSDSTKIWLTLLPDINVQVHAVARIILHNGGLL